MAGRYRCYRCIARYQQSTEDDDHPWLETESCYSILYGYESSLSFEHLFEDLEKDNYITEEKFKEYEKDLRRNERKRQCLQQELFENETRIRHLTYDYDTVLKSEKNKNRNLKNEVSKLHSILKCQKENLERTTLTNTKLKEQMIDKDNQMKNLQNQLDEVAVELDRFKGDQMNLLRQIENLKRMIFFQDVDKRNFNCTVDYLQSQLRNRHEHITVSDRNSDHFLDLGAQLQNAMAHITEIETDLRRTKRERDLALDVQKELKIKAKMDENRIISLENEIKDINLSHKQKIEFLEEKMIEVKEKNKRGNRSKDREGQVNKTNTHKEGTFTKVYSSNTEQNIAQNEKKQDFISQGDNLHKKELTLTDEQSHIISLSEDIENRDQMLKALEESLENTQRQVKSEDNLNEVIKEMAEKISEQQNQIKEALTKLKEKEAKIDVMTHEWELERQTRLDLEEMSRENKETVEELTSESYNLKQTIQALERDIKKRDLELKAFEEQAEAEDSMQKGKVYYLKGQIKTRDQTLKALEESLENTQRRVKSEENLNKIIKEMEGKLSEQQTQTKEAFTKLREKKAKIDVMTHERELERQTRLDLEKMSRENKETVEELTSENYNLKQRIQALERDITQRDLELKAFEEQAKAEVSMQKGKVNNLKGQIKTRDQTLKALEESLESTQKRVKSEENLNKLIKEMEGKISEQQNQLKKALTELREKEAKLDVMTHERDIERQTRLDFEKKSREKTKTIKELTSKNYDLTQRIQAFERDKKQRDIELQAFEEQTKAEVSMKKEIDNILREKDNQIAELEDQIKHVFARLKEAEAELEETKTRLSKAMGDRLKDNNPNIADLSDENRPVKLAERYSELYDNQWTDAFDFLSKSEDSEQSTIEALLHILQDITHFCISSASKQMEDLQGMLLFSKSSVGDIPVDIRLHLKNFRKALSKTAMTNLYKSYISHLKQTSPDTLRRAPEVRPYVKECFEICWLMSIQDPPVVFSPVAKQGSILNTNIYKPYTRSGTHVEYTVWPAMLLHEKGPILAKGIAQGRK